MTDKQDLARDGTLDGTRPIASGQAAVDGADADAGAAPDFLADLARAMQAAASAQRKHIADVAEQRKKAHIDAVHKRETTENEELREVSSRDVKGIEAWATAEIERIRLERQRRIAARKTELEEQLEQHHSMIETRDRRGRSRCRGVSPGSRQLLRPPRPPGGPDRDRRNCAESPDVPGARDDRASQRSVGVDERVGCAPGMSSP